MERFKARITWICIILGVLFFVGGISDTIDSKKTPADFNSLNVTDLQEGMIVEGDISSNYGPYEEEYRTTYGIKTGESDYTYLIEIGENHFMGLKNQTDEQQIALDDQANKTIDILFGYSTTQPETFHFKGRIVALDSQDKGFMKDYLNDLGYSESTVEKYMVGYAVECVDFKGGLGETGIGFALLVIGVGIIITPWLEKRKRERLLYTDEPITTPVMNQYVNNSDAFSSNTNTNQDEPLKMSFSPSSPNLSKEQTNTEKITANTYKAEHISNSNDTKTSQEVKPKSGLSLRLKDE